MKKTYSLIAIAATLAVFTSCNEKSKLASEITGAWSGQAERVEVSGAKTTTTVTRMLTFATDAQSATGGDLQAKALFSVESGTELEAAGTQPIAVTVNGVATITGHWEALDDDDVMVSFDASSLKVNIDPEEVVLEYTIATGDSEPVSETVSPDVVEAVSKSITSLLQTRVFNYSKIEDIKVKGTLMSCELDKRDYTFHKDM